MKPWTKALWGVAALSALVLVVMLAVPLTRRKELAPYVTTTEAAASVVGRQAFDIEYAAQGLLRAVPTGFRPTTAGSVRVERDVVFAAQPQVADPFQSCDPSLELPTVFEDITGKPFPFPTCADVFDAQPDVDPTLTEFASTCQKLASQTPEGFAAGMAMAPDGTQVLSSMPNGHAGFAQLAVTDQGLSPQDADDHVTGGGHRTWFPASRDEGAKAVLDVSTSRVGTGPQAVAVASDGSRLYVAARRSRPYDQPLPFGSTASDVEVWTRPVDTRTGRALDTAWLNDQGLRVRNPFGALVADFLLEDDFGRTLVAGDHGFHRTRLLAVRSRRGPPGLGTGACVMVFEERDGAHQVISVLPSDDPDFGRVLALRDRMLVVSRGGGGFEWFVRSKEDERSYQSKGTVASPALVLAGELFAQRSLVLGPRGRVLMVGSPQAPGGSGMGHLVVLTRPAGALSSVADPDDTTGWTVQQAIGGDDVRLAVPGLRTNGTFASWVHADPRMRAVAVTYSTHNSAAAWTDGWQSRDQPPASGTGDVQHPATVAQRAAMVVFAVDHRAVDAGSGDVVVVSTGYVFQQEVAGSTVSRDPLWGSAAALGDAAGYVGGGNLRLAVGSPLDQTCQYVELQALT